MQKINLAEREVIAAKKPFWPDQAECHILLEAPGAVYAKHDGTDVLIGYGTEFRFRLDQPCEVWASVKGVRIRALSRVVENAEDVFTNFDKRPAPSAIEQAVTLALRRMKRAEKEHAARLRREREAVKVEDPEDEADPSQQVEDVEAPAEEGEASDNA